MQYENNHASGFPRYRSKSKRKGTAARPDMVMTISPAPTLWTFVAHLASKLKAI